MTMEIAGETRSDARMASEGLRDAGTSRPEVSPTGKTEAFGVSRNHFDNNEL